MAAIKTLTRQYFDDLYRTSEDPWSFATSAYEAEKYGRSLQALAHRYRRGLEIGCSIGVFTARLAERCDALVAMDISDIALERARARCAGTSNIRFVHGAFPDRSPAGPFDLVTCCDVGYYWSDADLAVARLQIATQLARTGDLLLVHYLPRVRDHVRDGDAVHESFLDDPHFARVRSYRSEYYRLDMLCRR